MAAANSIEGPADTRPKGLEPVPLTPPPTELRGQRHAKFVSEGEKASRYTLPKALKSSSPVGYRTRLAFTSEEAAAVMPLLSLKRPEAFVAGAGPTEQELFEESSLGILSSRQSTNFKGQKSTVLGPEDGTKAAQIMGGLKGLEAPVLEGATHTWLVFTRPYRTPFTLLLTFIGHKPWVSFPSVLKRAWDKRFKHADDIPTIGYLQHLHLGGLADQAERAAVIASEGKRAAQVHLAPFCGAWRRQNRTVIRQLEDLGGLSAADRRQGWRLGFVAQVGCVAEPMAMPNAGVWRKLGANLLAMRSQRVMPGQNHETKAPPVYHTDQKMRVPEELTVQAGRAAYNAFAHWTGCDRERAKALLLLERIDVLTPEGGKRLGVITDMLGAITDRLIANLPAWADLPTGKLFSKNAARGRKAFALVGQRVYIAGLSRPEIEAEGLDFERATCGVGAAAFRSALYAELMGCTQVPEDCDLLAGICLMAGPVNQNDIGKQFYGYDDLLAGPFPDRDPTSMLVWTLKAKTVDDPIGNEEQLLNAARKGALVDLRCGPHELVTVRRRGAMVPARKRGEAVNLERAYADQGNFVTDPNGVEIPGNRGEAWPEALASAQVWTEA